MFWRLPCPAPDLAEIEQLSVEIQRVSPAFIRLREHLASVLWAEEMLDGLLVALLADGHVLLEGLPGLAKTTAVSTLALALMLHFNGFSSHRSVAGGCGWYRSMSLRRRPCGSQGTVCPFGLADEINRAPAKVDALLEAMQERRHHRHGNPPFASTFLGVGDPESN